MTTERWPDEFRGHLCLDVVIEVSQYGSLAALTVGLAGRSGDLVEWCRSGAALQLAVQVMAALLPCPGFTLTGSSTSLPCSLARPW